MGCGEGRVVRIKVFMSFNVTDTGFPPSVALMPDTNPLPRRLTVVPPALGTRGSSQCADAERRLGELHDAETGIRICDGGRDCASQGSGWAGGEVSIRIEDGKFSAGIIRGGEDLRVIAVGSHRLDGERDFGNERVSRWFPAR